MCTKEGCPGEFSGEVAKDQPLDFVTRGKQTLSPAVPSCGPVRWGCCMPLAPPPPPTPPTPPTPPPTTDGIVTFKRAAFLCKCGTLVWQAPADFIRVGAWPASLSDSRLKTVIDIKLLQLWDSMYLHNPQTSLTGFLSAITHAAGELRPTTVSWCVEVCCATTCVHMHAHAPTHTHTHTHTHTGAAAG